MLLNCCFLIRYKISFQLFVNFIEWSRIMVIKFWKEHVGGEGMEGIIELVDLNTAREKVPSLVCHSVVG